MACMTVKFSIILLVVSKGNHYDYKTLVARMSSCMNVQIDIKLIVASECH